MENQRSISKPVFWTGTILKWLSISFLLFDAIMKIIKHSKSVEGTQQLGLPENCVQFLGIYLLLSTILYFFQRTAILGGLLLTAYLGGAVAVAFRSQNDGHPYLFPLLFAIMLWIAEYLRNIKMRNVLPIIKQKQ